LKIFKPTWRDN